MTPLPLLLLAAITFDEKAVTAEFQKTTKGFKGRVGICIEAGGKTACNLGDQRFSLQSVMKFVSSLAVLDEVDQGRWKLDTRIRIERKDLSAFHQPIEEEVGPKGYETTVADLIRRANVDSDSAAVDILIDRLGGAQKVQQYLTRKGIRDVRIDRTERDLQSEINAVTWRPEYGEDKVFRAAIAAMPRDTKAKAYAAYQKDVRDTATPLGMIALLRQFVEGKLISPNSTAFLLKVLESTKTGPDRITAGLSAPWRLAHRTGSSGCFEGLCAATNDVGLLRSPKGDVAIAIFVGDSTADDKTRAAVMAELTRVAIRYIKLQ